MCGGKYFFYTKILSASTVFYSSGNQAEAVKIDHLALRLIVHYNPEALFRLGGKDHQRRAYIHILPDLFPQPFAHRRRSISDVYPRLYLQQPLRKHAPKARRRVFKNQYYHTSPAWLAPPGIGAFSASHSSPASWRFRFSSPPDSKRYARSAAIPFLLTPD